MKCKIMWSVYRPQFFAASDVDFNLFVLFLLPWLAHLFVVVERPETLSVPFLGTLRAGLAMRVN